MKIQNLIRCLQAAFEAVAFSISELCNKLPLCNIIALWNACNQKFIVSVWSCFSQLQIECLKGFQFNFVEKLVCLDFQEHFYNPASLTLAPTKWQKFTSSLMVQQISPEKCSFPYLDDILQKKSECYYNLSCFYKMIHFIYFISVLQFFIPDMLFLNFLLGCPRYL